MEAGSLLREALSRQVEQDFFDSEYALCLDVYLLQDDRQNGVQQLLDLAEVGNELNQYFQSQHYRWHIGGDGPIFGIHTSGKQPHLRALCRYGANVADEWMSVHFLLTFTSGKNHLVAECWDIQDGQVLLIESAEVLPAWVDQIGPEACRHRCWIQQGKVVLIAPKIVIESNPQQNALELVDALNLLRVHNSLDNFIVSSDDVQQAVLDCISRLASPNTPSSHYHKAVLAIPRSVAIFIERRPELVNTAIVAFANIAQDSTIWNKQRENSKSSSDTNLVAYEDLVYTTHPFSKTNYAMLRSIVSPEWKTEDYIPPSYKSVELRRIQRQCAVEATPHLRHAVQLGVRLVAGLNGLLQMLSKQNASSLSLKEERVIKWWTRISQELDISPQWLIEAWQAGPNRTAINLDCILQCPVFHEELEMNPYNITPFSHPETPVQQQILKELRTERPEKDFLLPRPEEVDSNEEWMTLSAEHADTQMSSIRGERLWKENRHVPEDEEETAQLDSMLGAFKSFMVDKSDIQGVVHDGTNSAGVKINPRVFLNLLRTALDPSISAESIVFPSTPPTQPAHDEFFSKEDYEHMMPADDDSDGSNEPIDTDFMNLMNAMDNELKGTAAMQTDDLDIVNQDNVEHKEGTTGVEEHARILSNLLQSLDAGASGPGPVRNMMRAMGQAPPLLQSEDPDDVHGNDSVEDG